MGRRSVSAAHHRRGGPPWSYENESSACFTVSAPDHLAGRHCTRRALIAARVCRLFDADEIDCALAELGGVGHTFAVTSVRIAGLAGCLSVTFDSIVGKDNGCRPRAEDARPPADGVVSVTRRVDRRARLWTLRAEAPAERTGADCYGDGIRRPAVCAGASKRCRPMGWRCAAALRSPVGVYLDRALTIRKKSVMQRRARRGIDTVPPSIPTGLARAGAFSFE